MNPGASDQPTPYRSLWKEGLGKLGSQFHAGQTVVSHIIPSIEDDLVGYLGTYRPLPDGRKSWEGYDLL